MILTWKTRGNQERHKYKVEHLELEKQILHKYIWTLLSQNVNQIHLHN